MSTGASQTQWNPITNHIENNDIKNADADYTALLGKPLDLDGARSAMGGIGEIDPETGKEIADQALGEEARDGLDEPDLDFSAFDNPNETDPQLQAANTEPSLGNNESIEQAAPVETIGEGEDALETAKRQLSCEYAPLLVQFQSQGKITGEQANSLIEQGINSENFHGAIQACDLNNNQAEELTTSLEYISSEKSTDAAEIELQDTFPDMFSKFKDPDLETVDPSMLESYRAITEHYIPHGDSPEEQDKNLDLAIKMATSQILNKGVLNLTPGNKVTLDEALKDIVSTDKTVEEKIPALQVVTNIKNVDQSKKGGGKKQAELFQKRKKAGQQALEADNAFQTAQSQTIENNTKQSSQVEDTPNLVDSEQLSGGDVYAAGKSDVAMQGNESGSETA